MVQDSNPISRPFKLDQLSSGGNAIELDANSEEMAALVRVAELEDLQRFKVRFELSPWRKTGVKVSGTIDAVMTRQCVVSLVSIDVSMLADFSVTFVPSEEEEKYRVAPNEEGEIEFDLESADPPEFFEGGTIDLGDVAVEQFLLLLDPYPRAEGVEFATFSTDPEGPEADDDKPPSPFSVLSELKKPD